MTKDDIAKFVTQTSAFKMVRFLDFMDNPMIDINIRNISKAVVILDNVPFHKHVSIREKFAETNNVLLYLPPYSPFLNQRSKTG